MQISGDPAVHTGAYGDLVERAAVRLGEWPRFNPQAQSYKVETITGGIGVSVVQPPRSHASRLEPLGDTTGLLVGAIREIGQWSTTWPPFFCRIRVRVSATLTGSSSEIHLQGGDSAALTGHLLACALHVAPLVPGECVRVTPGSMVRAMLLSPSERPIALEAHCPGVAGDEAHT